MTCQQCGLWAGELTLGTCMWRRSKVYQKQTWNWEKTPCENERDPDATKALRGEGEKP